MAVKEKRLVPESVAQTISDSVKRIAREENLSPRLAESLEAYFTNRYLETARLPRDGQLFKVEANDLSRAIGVNQEELFG
jgi:hypothetical protein